jgi:hypothetical protein
VAGSEAPPDTGPLVTKDFCYPLIRIRGADQAARGVEGCTRVSPRGTMVPRRDIGPMGRVSGAGCCRTGRTETWCTWSYWSSLPLRLWLDCGCSSAGSKLRWTPSRGSPLLLTPWPLHRDRRAESGPATVGAAFGCRGRRSVRCSGGSSRRRLDLMPRHALRRAAKPKLALQPNAKTQFALRRAAKPKGALWHDAGMKLALPHGAEMKHARGEVATAKSAYPITVAGPRGISGARCHRGESRLPPGAYPTSPVTSATRVSPARRMFGQ